MNLRELKYVILGEDRLSSKLDRIGSASDKVGKKLEQNSEKLSFFRRNIEVASESVPGFGSKIATIGTAASLVSAPLALAALGVAGVGMALNKGVNEAKSFELEFSKLRNLNLDKTKDQVDELKSKILELSYSKGFDPGKTANAYFDVESLTGNFGKATEDVISKQGEVAKIMDADFNKYITGSAAAMKNFGFGPEKLDEYNRSMYATMQTALVNYDQLSQISTIYAGSAKGANQSVDSANKLFALFTPLSKTGTPEEAATQTKTAFQDLFKPETRKAFKDVGINLYDTHNKAKQVGDIILELNKKFSKLGDNKSMDILRGKFKGSEGLIALVNLATDKSGNLQKTLQAFDSSKFDWAKALKEAGEDINKIDEKVSGKLTSSFVKFGETVLPTLVKIKGTFSDIIDSFNTMFGKSSEKYFINSHRDYTANALRSTLFSSLDEQLTAIFRPGEYKKKQAQKGYTSLVSEIKNTNPVNVKEMPNDKFIKTAGEMLNKSISYGNLLVGGGKIDDGNFQYWKAQRDAYKSINEDMWSERKKIYGDSGVMPAIKKSKTHSSSSLLAGSDSVKNGIAGISAGGAKNVTVSIKSLVEHLNINTTNLKEGSGEVKRVLEELLVRAVSGAEQTIGTN